jgi:type I restriction enzyme S subunit
MAYSDVFVALSTGIRVRSTDLRWNKLIELFYPLPPIDEQDSIVKEIDYYLEKTNKIIVDKQKQIEILQRLKNSLIHECVTGKIEV